jgi:threonine dehydratase
LKQDYKEASCVKGCFLLENDLMKERKIYAMVSLEDIREAREIISGIIHETGIFYSKTFSQQTHAHIYLKPENYQKTGSFKIRGAYYKIAKLSEEQRKKGVVTVSAGNHSQAVAYAAQSFGIPATIIMPEFSSLAQVSAVENYGAKVIIKGKTIEKSIQEAIKFSESGMTYIHPFDDEEIIAGQGTIALEMLDEVRDLDAIVVPIGGGGLISGIAVAAKTLRPSIKIIGVEAEQYNAVKLSLEQGENICVYSNDYTLADGLAVGKCGKITYQIISQMVDEIITVSDDEVSSAIFWLLERSKQVVEGAGAVGVAALLAGKLNLPNKRIGIVISGGNIDFSILQSITDKGLVRENRRVEFKLLLKDKPGELHKVTDIISSTYANIYSFSHDRTKDGMNHGYVSMNFTIETKDKNHITKLVDKLKKNGFQIV